MQQSEMWLPLTEYALRSGISISTLRRKIKSNSIKYKMDEGRYLIRGDELEHHESDETAFHSSDTSPAPIKQGNDVELENLRKGLDAGALRWRAMEARVSGLAKKMDIYFEHVAELKMLVRLFEEKLDKIKT